MLGLKNATALAKVAAIAVGMGLAVTGSCAADTDADKQKLAQCAKDICSIIVSKNATGPDLACDLTKTWEKEQIQKGADEKKLSWGMGYAKCSAKVNAKRSELVGALASPEKALKFDKHAISCEIERGGEKYPISATISPELQFKDGKAVSSALRMDDIKGTTLIKGVVWTAATLEQNFGLFESDMTREVNRFIQKECPKIVGDGK